MVFGFLGGLIGRKPQAAPAASQQAGDEELLGSVRVDLYMVKEVGVVEILSDAGIKFMPDSVVFEGEAQKAAETVGKVVQSGPSGDKYAFEFQYDAIEKFRQHEADMCQWSIAIDNSSGQEFGLVFPCESSAAKFHRQLVARICEVAFQEVASAPCILAEYDRLALQWRNIEEDAVAHIRERISSSEAFVLVTKADKGSNSEEGAAPPAVTSTITTESGGPKGPSGQESGAEVQSDKGSSDAEPKAAAGASASKSKGSGSAAAAAGSKGGATSTLKPAATKKSDCASEKASDSSFVVQDLDSANFIDQLLCYVKVSHGEFLYPLSEQHELQWWGTPSDGEKRLYRIKFADDALLKRLAGKDPNATLDGCKKSGQRFFDAFSLTLAEVTSGCRLSGNGGSAEPWGSSDLYECANDEEEEGMRISDAESDPSDDEDQFPVVARDPTRDILRTRPNDMVNHLLEPGHQRSVVFRVGGSDFGPALKRDMQLVRFEEGRHSVVATVDGSKLNIRGKTLEPSSAMLHSCEEQLVMLDENDQTSAYLMDLEAEKVVAKLDLDGKKAEAVLPVSCDAKTTAEPTFLCMNKNSFFAVDTRMKGKARAQTYTYSGNQGLSCGATTGDGGIVLGSSKGVLRLYDGKTNDEGAYKRAKTQLSGLGDPILHVATTTDGSWVLATCATYLELYPVRLSSTKRTGFVTALGAQKPKPFILKLDIADVCKYNLQNCSFKKAGFDESEKLIYTATNNLAIVWDFVAVKNGKVNAYEIRPIGDFIKDVAVLRDGDDPTVVMVTPCSLTTRHVRRIKQGGSP